MLDNTDNIILVSTAAPPRSRPRMTRCRDIVDAAILFAPALVAWTLWAYVLTINDAWAASFSSYWTMSIALVFGSLLAGSTPCSAGVVIYPLTQLAPLHPPPDARDISVLLQAVGLAAASYTIVLRKRMLLEGTGYLLFFFCVFGAVGVLFGLFAALARDLANVIFTSTVFGFALAYCYTSELLPAPRPQRAASEDASPPEEEVDQAGADGLTALAACLCALCGGFLTATIGTGADLACFSFGIFGWNMRHPTLALDGSQLTAASVVTMACVSIFASLARSMTGGGFSQPTLLCWGAMVPIVVVGAPIGSLVLSPLVATALRRLFYGLAAFQFACYVAFAPDPTSVTWRLVAGGLVAEVVVIAYHYHSQVGWLSRGYERG